MMTFRHLFSPPPRQPLVFRVGFERRSNVDFCSIIIVVLLHMNRMLSVSYYIVSYAEGPFSKSTSPSYSTASPSQTLYSFYAGMTLAVILLEKFLKSSVFRTWPCMQHTLTAANRQASSLNYFKVKQRSITPNIHTPSIPSTSFSRLKRDSIQKCPLYDSPSQQTGVGTGAMSSSVGHSAIIPD